MASPFETEGTILTQEQADHINEWHVSRDQHARAAKFTAQIPLVELLKSVSELTWDEENANVYILEEGWKECHGHFYLFVFKLSQIIGTDPDGFPAKHLAVYYSEKVPGEKWQIVSAYPFNLGHYKKFQAWKSRSH